MWSLIQPKARHIWALAIFVSLLLSTIYVVTINSEDYKEAIRFISEDTQMEAFIGRVDNIIFKFWNGFESGGGNANYSFDTTTQKGDFKIDVRLKQVSGVWRVNIVDITEFDGIKKRIVAAQN